ncbi:MAG: hypothetical protein QGG36_20285 [Pirellulaceae bacterium]|nr:hypothetical protein [Pirellulaceae bacterium]MDP7018154.1 hypothetical protein [Pirellulaceae bacterium]
MQSQRAEDAAFFDMVHETVQECGLLREVDEVDEAGGDRRTEQRISFEATQLIAPFDGKQLPVQADFRHVQFLDISTHGFAYLDSPKPCYEYVITLFGNLPFRIFAARVMHTLETHRPGTYKVGCQIIKRVSG